MRRFGDILTWIHDPESNQYLVVESKKQNKYYRFIRELIDENPIHSHLNEADKILLCDDKYLEYLKINYCVDKNAETITIDDGDDIKGVMLKPLKHPFLIPGIPKFNEKDNHFYYGHERVPSFVKLPQMYKHFALNARQIIRMEEYEQGYFDTMRKYKLARKWIEYREQRGFHYIESQNLVWTFLFCAM